MKMIYQTALGNCKFELQCKTTKKDEAVLGQICNPGFVVHMCYSPRLCSRLIHVNLPTTVLFEGSFGVTPARTQTEVHFIQRKGKQQ